MRLMIGVCLLGVAGLCQAQQEPDLAAQREAMKKLGFLVGRWSGDASVRRGPGEPMKIVQTEEVQYKLDGLVLLVEGTGRDTTGKVVYQALATAAYDDQAHAYRFRAYNSGRYLDTELTVTPSGFAWGFTAGPVKISNTMHLDDQGEWIETTDVVFGEAPPRRSVEMKLKRVP